MEVKSTVRPGLQWHLLLLLVQWHSVFTRLQQSATLLCGRRLARTHTSVRLMWQLVLGYVGLGML